VKMKIFIFTKVKMKIFIVTHFHSFSLKWKWTISFSLSFTFLFLFSFSLLIFIFTSFYLQYLNILLIYTFRIVPPLDCFGLMFSDNIFLSAQKRISSWGAGGGAKDLSWGRSLEWSLALVSISFSRNNKNVSLNTDCDRLSATYSYVSHGMRRLVSFMFCVFQASCGVHMVMQSIRTTRAIPPSPKHI
jgi:hypothetical protein